MEAVIPTALLCCCLLCNVFYGNVYGTLIELAHEMQQVGSNEVRKGHMCNNNLFRYCDLFMGVVCSHIIHAIQRLPLGVDVNDN